jgi:ACS family hexuronate transporter-like MFS transporter
MSKSQPTPRSTAPHPPKIGNYRWTICALVFFATTINYVDRNVIGQLKDTLLPLIRWEEGNVFRGLLDQLAAWGWFKPYDWSKNSGDIEYSWIVNAFQISYALGLVLVGRFVDRLGSKRGYGLALTGWSLAAIGHAFSSGFASFAGWRAALGFTEAGNFPAAQKTVSEWFPKKERALATGIYNSGTNVGAIIAPLVVPWLATHFILGWSWEWAFVITGAVGLLWLVFWFALYKSPAAKLAEGKLSQAEYDYIHGDADEQAENTAPTGGAQEKAPWAKLLKYRQTWAFFFGKFFTDPIWWFYLFWLPGFLSDDNRAKILAAYPNGLPEGIRIEDAARELQSFTSLVGATPILDKLPDAKGLVVWPVAVAVVYTISVFGSVFGGYLPKRLVDSGMDVNKARKGAMFLYALFPLTVLAAMRLGGINTWLAVLVIGIGAAAHQAWSANIFTTVPDMFPKKAVASVTGIGGMAGTLGSVIFQPVVGFLLAHYKAQDSAGTGYAIIFVVCSVAYIFAWFVMHLLVPKFKKITDL